MSPEQHEDLLDRLRKVEDKIDGLIGFQRFLMGVVATAGAMVGFLADPIKKKLGLN